MADGSSWNRKLAAAPASPATCRANASRANRAPNPPRCHCRNSIGPDLHLELHCLRSGGRADMDRMKIFVVASSMFAALVSPAHPSEQAVPDFSGVWGRSVFNFEPTESGPQPLRNLKRVGPDASRPVVVGDPVP